MLLLIVKIIKITIWQNFSKTLYIYCFTIFSRIFRFSCFSRNQKDHEMLGLRTLFQISFSTILEKSIINTMVVSLECKKIKKY